MTKAPLCIQPLPGIGDVVWFLPHMRAIAYGHASQKIYILTKKSTLADQLLENEPWVAGYIWLERDHRLQAKAKKQKHDGIFGRWRLAKELEQYEFDQAWSLHHSGYYRHVMALARIKNRHGFTIGSKSRLLNHNVILPKEYKARHFREQVSAFLEMAGFDLAPFHSPIKILPTAHQAIQKEFGDKTKPRIAFGIGASGDEKIWPAKKFAQLAQHLTPDYQICLCGGTSEQPIAEKIKQLFPGNSDLLLNSTNLPLQQSLALLASCDRYIGNDTSLMNLAVNQGVKTIGLFGPTYTVYSDLIQPLVAADKQVRSIPVESVVQLVRRKQG
jgi:heptosyltransferase-2